MWEQQFMEKYNYWIGRENKAVAFFEANPEKITDKMIEEYHKIVKEIGQLLKRYEAKFGQELPLEERLNGFKI